MYNSVTQSIKAGVKYERVNEQNYKPEFQRFTLVFFVQLDKWHQWKTETIADKKIKAKWTKAQQISQPNTEDTATEIFSSKQDTTVFWQWLMVDSTWTSNTGITKDWQRLHADFLKIKKHVSQLDSHA